VRSGYRNIQIEEDIHKKLKEMKTVKGEPFNSVVKRLIEKHEKEN
jgi:predicted CopG family antitoxin